MGLDVADFRQLFDEHSAFVWRVLARHGVLGRDLDDACQEVFLVVHARWADFEGRSSVRTWLYGIALRVALNARRKHARRPEQLEAAPAQEVSDGDPCEIASRRQALAHLQRALSQLTPEKREVFVLYELEGMTMAEVARTLEVPENTALSRLYSARDEIKAWLRRRENVVTSPAVSQSRRTAV